MINRQDGRPAYRQVADAIRADIESGKLRPRDALPSIADIQRTHKVSNGTAQNAVRYLRSQGLIESRQGAGSFVREERPWIAVTASWWAPPGEGEPDYWTAQTKAHGFAGTQEIVHVGPVAPSDVVRAELGTEDETVVIRDRILYLDGVPMQLVQSYYPHDIADGTPLAEPRKIRGGAPKILAALPDPPIEVLETDLTRMPTEGERIALDLSEAVPVLDLLLTAVTGTGRAVEVITMVVRGDRHRLRHRYKI